MGREGLKSSKDKPCYHLAGSERRELLCADFLYLIVRPQLQTGSDQDLHGGFHRLG